MTMHLKALVALLGWSIAMAAVGQGYPDKPVKIIVGYAAGGGPDVVARLLAQKLTQSLGQPFVVESRVGATGTIATAQVAKSLPDGYTLLLGETAQLAIVPYVYKTLGYDPAKDLAPVALMITAPLVLVSSVKTTQIKTLDALIREATARPGKLDYGTVGIGSMYHTAMETMKADLGISVTHIPYKGGPLTVSALLTGEVPLILTTVSSLGQNIGQANILAVTSKDRYAVLPEVPSISEVIKGYDFSSQMGVLAPAGTPPEVVAKLSSAIKAAIHSPDFLDQLKTMGFAMTWGSPEAYADNIRQKLAKYARAVMLANIQPE